MTSEQTKALNELRNLSDVVIKASDKGGNIVLMDSCYYEKMCFDILRNADWYRPIPDSYYTQLHSKYNVLVGDAYSLGTIDKDTFEFLTVKFPVFSTFYALLKTHKNLKRPPGRPIVSGNGNLTEQASQLVDRHLRPFVTSLFSYTKDTLDLLKQIEGLTVPPDALLVSLDVESLYCSIPHDRGSQW